MSLRFDLHCHTTHSDGALSTLEVAEAAASAGLSVVGIADHHQSTALPAGSSLGVDQIAVYVEELRSLRGRMRERVTVLAGLEINFSLVQSDLSFLSRYETDSSPVAVLDFVLFEHVNDADQMGLGLEELLKIRPLFPIPIGLAHNDLERNFGGILQPESLAQILAQSRIFVELSASARHLNDDSGVNNPASEGSAGSMPWYRSGSEFCRRFFAAAKKHGLDLSLGSDAHDSVDEVGDVSDAATFLEEQGLEANAIVLKHWGGTRA